MGVVMPITHSQIIYCSDQVDKKTAIHFGFVAVGVCHSVAELQKKSGVGHKGRPTHLETVLYKMFLNNILQCNRVPIKSGNIALMKQCWENSAHVNTHCLNTVFQKHNIWDDKMIRQK